MGDNRDRTMETFEITTKQVIEGVICDTVSFPKGYALFSNIIWLIRSANGLARVVDRICSGFYGTATGELLPSAKEDLLTQVAVVRASIDGVQKRIDVLGFSGERPKNPRSTP
jgi:hypothetical protein